MRKRQALIAIVGMVLLLAACSQASPTSTTGTDTPAVPDGQLVASTTSEAPPAATTDEAPPAAATSEVPPAAATGEATPAEPVEFQLDPETACQAFDSRNELEPVPGISPANSDDWSKGAAEGSTVLMEYGDYQ